MTESQTARRVAILHCMKTAQRCNGAGCMNAFFNHQSTFAPYAEDGAVMTSFMMCNGCDSDVATDVGLQQKLDRLASSDTEVVHIGVCTKDHDTGAECERITRIARMIEDRGMQTVRGTH